MSACNILILRTHYQQNKLRFIQLYNKALNIIINNMAWYIISKLTCRNKLSLKNLRN